MSFVLFWLLVSVGFFAVGEYLSKSWALQPSVNKALLLISMYVAGTIAWLPAIHRGQTISVVGTIWSLLSLITTLFVGIIIFHETLTVTQIVGLCFGVVAVVLLSI